MDKCIKCGDQAVVIPRLKDSFCRSCFVSYTTHKFRASIGKSKLIRDNEHVLVAVSGGPSSTCLLHLVQQGFHPDTKKRLRFRCTVAFIDETSTVDLSQSDRIAYLASIREELKKSGLPSYMWFLEESPGLESVFMDREPPPITQSHIRLSDVDDFSVVQPAIEKRETLRAALDAVDSLSSKEEFLKHLRNRLLLVAASRLGCTKIATGHCSDRLAVIMLSDIARGQGAHVSDNMGFCDTHDSIQTFRPLKDFTSKEVAFYNRLHGLNFFMLPTFTTKTEPISSIERLTETFIKNLQTDYSSTIPNITRTGEKLAVLKFSTSSKRCLLCDKQIDRPATVSTNESHLSQDKSSNTGDDSARGSCDTSFNSVGNFCYGCSILASDFSSFSCDKSGGTLLGNKFS